MLSWLCRSGFSVYVLPTESIMYSIHNAPICHTGTALLGSIYTKKDRNGPPSANQVISRDKPRHGHAVCTLQLHPPTSPCPALIAEAEPISKGRKWHHEAESLMTDISTMGRNKKQFIQTQQIHKSHHLMFHEEIWVGWHVATSVAIFSLHVPVFYIHTIHTCM